MQHLKKWKLPWLMVVLLPLLLAARPPADSAAAGQESQPEKPAAAPAAPQSAPTGDYVGNDTCITCHDDQQKRFKNTVMGKIMAHPRTPAEEKGCESCHGPGKAHVEAGGGKETIPIRFGPDSKNSIDEQNRACLACHERGNRLFWKGSPHDSRRMACVDCHQVKQEIQRSVSSENRYQAP